MQQRRMIASVSAVLTALVLAGGPASALAAPSKSDKASPKLMQFCLQGKQIDKVLL